MRVAPGAVVTLVLAGLTSVALAACSSPNEDAALVEYPPGTAPEEPPSADGGPPPAVEPGRDAGPDAAEPIVGTKLLSEPVNVEDVTSDGHLVFSTFADLKVWPAGATGPVTLVKDYDFEFDSFTVRGRLVFAWLGESQSPSAVTTWGVASGLKTGGAVSKRLAVYPKPSAETFAYLGASANLLRSKVSVTAPGQGDGTLIVPLLDSGLTADQCKPTVTWAGNDLLVAGCTGGSTTPRVATYATNGSGASTSVLEGSAPGVWLNRARSRALVQTSTASSLRALGGAAAAPLPLDTPVVRAVFAADDTKVVYLRADGKARRASTTAPVSPVDLGTAKEILAISPDARFTVLATVVDTSERTDLVVVDANAPASPRKLATEKAISYGITKDGASFVYQVTTGIGADGPLFVVPLTGGAPQKIAEEASRVVFDGGVVYWQEYVKAQKTNVLKAVRLSAPQAVLTLDQGLDPLTAFAVLAGPKLFVASKLGLWSYPALSP